MEQLDCQPDIGDAELARSNVRARDETLNAAPVYESVAWPVNRETRIFADRLFAGRKRFSQIETLVSVVRGACGAAESRRINNVSVQMVCSECAVALTRINVPFAIYIAHVWHGNVRARM